MILTLKKKPGFLRVGIASNIRIDHRLDGLKKPGFFSPGPFLNILIAFLILALGTTACRPVSAAATNPGASPAVTFTSVQIPTATRTVTPPATNTTPAQKAATAPPSQTAVSQPLSIWLPGYLPQHLRDEFKLPAGWIVADRPENAGLRLEITTDPTLVPHATPWIYALVAPFPTIADDIPASQLRSAWKDVPARDAPFQKILADANTAALFAKLWGAPGPAVQTLPADSLIDAAWQAKTAWAILPFEQIEPRWKVISVDGQSPIRKDFQSSNYPLQVSFLLAGNPSAIAAFKGVQASPPESNRRADRLTTVVLTGTTALVRGTASLMEQRGLDYPAQEIGDWLREADILHISNEVAFAKNCPPPYDWKDLVFCSRPKYIKLLEDIGTDVVDLAGDHLSDWGPDAVLYTLDLYKQEGWKTYGGGANIEEARKPALFDHNGNKIAFIGCNAKPKGYAQAGPDTPGAIHCDMGQMAAEVKQLRADGYLPIVTFQHLEYYAYTANPILQKDFRQMADAGAVVVSGSQAHQPHAFEFKDGAMLHYGLGNLFFDQTNQGEPPRTAFIDRHVFYDGRYISTELLTIYFVNYALSRPMTLPERQELLKTVFQASGW